MENLFVNNSSQKYCKLSIYSSESGGYSIGSVDGNRSVIPVPVEDLENLLITIKNALDSKGKILKYSNNLLENLKESVSVLCMDYTGQTNEINKLDIIDLQPYQHKDIWARLSSSEKGCFLNNDECREVYSMMAGLLREYGWEEMETKVRNLEESLVSAKLHIKRDKEIIQKKIKEYNYLLEEYMRLENIAESRDPNTARFIESETTNYEDNLE